MATSSNIDQIAVASSNPFIVYGPVRGIVSEHRSERAAFASLHRDRQGCHQQRGYSDAAVYMAHDGEWIRCADFSED